MGQVSCCAGEHQSDDSAFLAKAAVVAHSSDFAAFKDEGLLRSTSSSSEAPEPEPEASSPAASYLASFDADRQNLDHEAFEQLLKLCHSGNVLEASIALKDIEHHAREAHNGASIMERLKSNPVICQLREVRDRYLWGFTKVVEPAWKTGETCVTMSLQDAKIGDLFKMQMRIRRARGSERDPNGAATQLIISIRANGFPMSLTETTCLQSEVDLWQKEWLKDCEHVLGFPGGPNGIYSAACYSLLAPKLLPFRIEDAYQRDFIICKTAPNLVGSRPGVTVVESNLHDVMATLFKNADVPKRRNCVRMASSCYLNHYMPSLLGPTLVDMLGSAFISLPVWEWLLPLSLIKGFFRRCIYIVFAASQRTCA